jgi:hypothetical protein
VLVRTQVLSIIKVGKNNGSFQKRSAPMDEISAICNGKGKKLFVIIVSVLGHPKGGRRLTSNLLHRGDLDVFWNDPIVWFPVQFGKRYIHLVSFAKMSDCTWKMNAQGRRNDVKARGADFRERALLN